MGDNSQQWALWWQPREPVVDFAKSQEQELAKRQEVVVIKRQEVVVLAKSQEWDHAKEEEGEVIAFAKRKEKELAKRKEVVVAKSQEADLAKDTLTSLHSPVLKPKPNCLQYGPMHCNHCNAMQENVTLCSDHRA